MKTSIFKSLIGGVLGAVLIAGLPAVRATKPLVEEGVGIETQPVVQLAILLDTSGSMEGLIEQAKGQLWKIVNEFISARQNGKVPEVHVALFEYGKSTLPASEGYIRMIQPLSTDLDKVSEELFALKTNGGDEYCGWVIQEAVNHFSQLKQQTSRHACSRPFLFVSFLAPRIPVRSPSLLHFGSP